MHVSGRHARQANLLGALSLAINDRIRGALGDDAFGWSAAVALVHGLFRSGKTIDFLARVLGVSHPAAVRLVDRLEDEGLLERRPAPDGRARALFLTQAGELATTRILERRTHALNELIAPLSAAERKQLEPLLEKLLSGVVENRWDARRVCRLCNPAICELPDCPVDIAAGNPGRGSP